MGPYLVLQALRIRGAGEVYAAVDTRLERRVSLTLLCSQPDDRPSADDLPRLQREAQVLAGLRHPNLAVVYDVGVVDGDVYVATEDVDGRTLDQWLSKERRGWKEVVALLRQAGAGLAAAHAVGLAHGDFKPQSVWVSDTGVARVTDFGLAPASKDARDDQFSFAVTLYEALYQTPFLGVRARAATPATPSRRWVPSRIRRALSRALEQDPSARFSDMTGLLRELDPGPWPSRRSMVTAAGIILAALAGLVAASRHEARRGRQCDDVAEHAKGAWGQSQRDALRGAFGKTQLPHARHALETVSRELDGYLETWRAARVEACAATRLRAELSEALMSRRVACLDERLHDFRRLVDLFVTADAAVVTNAAALVQASLRSVAPCSDGRARALAALEVELAPAVLGEVDRLRAAASGPRLLHAAMDADAARAALLPLIEGARRTGHRPLLAELLVLRGRVELSRRDLPSAREALVEGVGAAIAGGDERTASEAWLHLGALTGYELARYEEGALYARLARAALERSGGASELRAAHETLVAKLLIAQGRQREGLRHLEEALAFARRHLDGNHRLIQEMLEVSAQVSFSLGSYGEALALARERLVRHEAWLGSEHPRVALTLAALSRCLVAVGELQEAERTLERAMKVATPAYSSGDPLLLELKGLAAAVEAGRQRFDLAVQVLRDALGDARAANPDSPSLTASEVALARYQKLSGDPLGAVATLREAEARAARVFGARSASRAMALASLGKVWVDLGRPVDALSALETALSIWAEAPGQLDFPWSLEAKVDVALALRAAHREPAREAALRREAEEELTELGARGKEALERLRRPLVRPSHPGPGGDPDLSELNRGRGSPPRERR